MKNKKMIKGIAIAAVAATIAPLAISTCVIASNGGFKNRSGDHSSTNGLILYDADDKKYGDDRTLIIPVVTDSTKVGMVNSYIWVYIDDTPYTDEVSCETTGFNLKAEPVGSTYLPGLYRVHFTQVPDTLPTEIVIKAGDNSISIKNYQVKKAPENIPTITWASIPAASTQLKRNATYTVQLTTDGGTYDWNSAHVYGGYTKSVKEPVTYGHVTAVNKGNGKFEITVPGDMEPNSNEFVIMPMLDAANIATEDVYKTFNNVVNMDTRALESFKVETSSTIFNGTNSSTTIHIADENNKPVNISNWVINRQGSSTASATKSTQETNAIIITSGSETGATKFDIYPGQSIYTGYNGIALDCNTIENNIKLDYQTCELGQGDSKIVKLTDASGNPVDDAEIDCFGKSTVSCQHLSTGQGQYQIKLSPLITVGDMFNIAFYLKSEGKITAATTCSITVKEATDWTLKAPDITPIGKVSTTEKTNEFVVDFYPAKSEAAEKLIASDWVAKIDAPTAVALPDPVISVTKGGTSAYLRVTVTTGQELGAGTLNIYRANEYKEGMSPKGTSPFYTVDRLLNLTCSCPTANKISKSPELYLTDEEGNNVPVSDFDWRTSNPEVATLEVPTGKASNTMDIKFKNVSDDPVYFYAESKTGTWTLATAKVEKITDINLNLYLGEATTKTTSITKKISGTSEFVSPKIKDDDGDLIYNYKIASSDTSVVAYDNDRLYFIGAGKANLTITFEKGNYKKQLVVPVTLTTAMYSFKGDAGQTTTFIDDDGNSHTIPVYKSGIISKLKGLVINEQDTPSKAETLTDFTYTVHNFDNAETHKIISGTAPIEVSKAGEVKVTASKTGVTALIECDCKTALAAPTFYVAYDICEDDELSIVSNHTGTDKLSDQPATLTVKMAGEDLGSGYTVTWESDNTAIAVITNEDGTGTLKYCKSNIAANIKATVTNTTSGAVNTVVKTITVGADSICGDKQQITSKIDGTPIKLGVLVNGYAASDTSIISYEILTGSEYISIDDQNYIHFNAAGNATIKTTYKPHIDAEAQSFTTPVTVTLEELALNYSWIKGQPFSDSIKLKAYNSTGEIQTSNLTFTSSNTSVARVSNEGNVTLLEEGTCNITVKYTDGTQSVSKDCNVTVNPSALVFARKKINAVGTNEGATLIPYLGGKKVEEDWADYLSWSPLTPETSTSTPAVTVTPSKSERTGKLVYHSKTTSPVTVTAKFEYISGTVAFAETAECEVTVQNPVFSLNAGSQIKSKKGFTYQLNCFLQGVLTKLDSNFNLDGYPITFATDDANIATVTQGGKISFVSEGTTKLRVNWACPAAFGGPQTKVITLKVITNE